MENKIDVTVLIKKLYQSQKWDFSYDLATVQAVFTNLDDGVKNMYSGALLMIAALYESSELINLLQLDINSANKTKDVATALIIAAGNNNIAAAKFLIGSGADCNYKNEQGDMALHIATFYGNVDFVKFWLENGANPSTRDSRGFSPLDCALTGFFCGVKSSSFKFRNPVYEQIVTALVQAGAQVADADKNGRTVIDEVALSESQIVELLEGVSLSMLPRHKKDLLCQDMKETIKIVQQFKDTLGVREAAAF